MGTGIREGEGSRATSPRRSAARDPPPHGTSWRLLAGFRSPPPPPGRSAPDDHTSIGRSRPGRTDGRTGPGMAGRATHGRLGPTDHGETRRGTSGRTIPLLTGCFNFAIPLTRCAHFSVPSRRKSWGGREKKLRIKVRVVDTAPGLPAGAGRPSGSRGRRPARSSRRSGPSPGGGRRSAAWSGTTAGPSGGIPGPCSGARY
jgi:hypothetical protein